MVRLTFCFYCIDRMNKIVDIIGCLNVNKLMGMMHFVIGFLLLPELRYCGFGISVLYEHS